MTKLNQMQGNPNSSARLKWLLVASSITIATMIIPRLSYSLFVKLNIINNNIQYFKYDTVHDVTLGIFAVLFTLLSLPQIGIHNGNIRTQ